MSLSKLFFTKQIVEILILHGFGRYHDNHVKSTKSIDDLMTLATFDTVTTLREGS
jgi:hypothetical protein